MTACEEFGELLSARRDGELDESEVVRLESHLARCEPCRRRQRRFEDLDRMLLELLDASAPDARSEHRLAMGVRENLRRGSSNPRSHWLPRIGLAAGFLVAATLLVLLTGNDAGGRERIAAPVAALELLNVERALDQEAVLHTLSLELRALRLEAVRLDPTDSDPERLLERIGSLLSTVEELSLWTGSEGKKDPQPLR
jgi:anti-sigma factor RsiW